MNLPADHIRLLFGLKLRQLRLDKGLSVSELAQKSGLSISYVTEIEKGRKYPKADKISALANAMQVDYDSLVSLKLSKKLEPISDLLRSKFLTEIPLELFGIDPSDLLELLAEAPAKVSAMIRTFMDIALSYNMSVERLYLTMLRSYQEMHDNYFPEIEAEADQFLSEFAPSDRPVEEALLVNLLKTRYDVRIEQFDTLTHPELVSLRSVYRPEQHTLHMNVGLSVEQRIFILAREVGFQFLHLKNRPYTYSWVEAESFEQILNNYKASYFAGAILIRRDALVTKVSQLFARETWSSEDFLQLISDFGATPERFFYRLSNVLPSHFGIDQLFFYRFNHVPGQTTFKLTKEMHLSRQQGPRGIVDEHFCRRWIAWTILQELQFLQQNKGFDGTLCHAQLSEYADSGSQYLIISVAHPFQPEFQQNMSVSMCFAVNDNLKSKMKFLNAPNGVASLTDIPFRVVNQTCERCGIFDCRERVAAPTVLQKKRQFEATKKAMEKLK
ncbi:helix-turn-helix domain-containing protein [Spirosoma sp. KCTC 42546]|uniref:helix-turn-helix domain-containing protein n=1 Tax=Spirosoma sp. KCTC 42546 TaxID=2520506 RepID=UPI00115B3B49|nr:helix-turn-helix transcriptional regulator [Spirosoma sp. KCTC 42546]QDK80032.1 helix-turn-helix domain-containing protein [Spirosoma sp. KCTC 42546]